MTIQKKLLKQAKGLDFTSVEELFDYVIQSKINGNSTQVSNLIKAMPKEGRKMFLSHADGFRNSNNIYKKESAIYCYDKAIDLL